MIFPHIPGPAGPDVNLDNTARGWRQRYPELFEGGQNPLFTDPDVCQQMVHDLHRRLGVLWSYGGWMEDRSTLWAGSYLEQEKKFIHLGVDLNVPAGTEVATDKAAQVLRIDTDEDRDGGWGTRVIVQHGDKDPYLLMYAHLAQDVRCAVGTALAAGEVFAKVGTPEENGQWYPHLHIQAVCARWFYELLQSDKNLATLDGYCSIGSFRDEDRRQAIERRFPNPLQFVEVPDRR